MKKSAAESANVAETLIVNIVLHGRALVCSPLKDRFFIASRMARGGGGASAARPWCFGVLVLAQGRRYKSLVRCAAVLVLPGLLEMGGEGRHLLAPGGAALAGHA